MAGTSANGATSDSVPFTDFAIVKYVIRPKMSATLSGNTLLVSWPSAYTGWRLEMQTNSTRVGLTSAWITVDDSLITNSMIFPRDSGRSAFFRLAYP